MAITKTVPDRSKPKRARKRDGPPYSSETVHVVESARKQNFEFIIMTDPKQARDKENQKSIRSHVMFDYAQQKRRLQASQPVPQQGCSSRTPDLRIHILNPSLMTSKDARDALKAASCEHDGQSSIGISKQSLGPLSRYYQALLRLKMSGPQSDRSSGVLALDETVFDLVWREGLVESYLVRGIGESIDPFFVMPQFRNPRIYMAQLKMWCKCCHQLN